MVILIIKRLNQEGLLISKCLIRIYLGKTGPVDCEHGKCSDVIVPRHELIEKIERIDGLETRLNQQLSEQTFQLDHAEKLHLIEMQNTCEHYETEIKSLRNERRTLENKYREERNLINSAIEQRQQEHSRTIIQMEAKLNEKFLTESEKAAELKTKMDEMIVEYEKKFQNAEENLEKTVDSLQMEFNVAINERENQIQKLLDEIKIKKEEFIEYCQHLTLDNDRKVSQIKLIYETRQKETNDSLLKWRTDASILTKKIESTTATCDELRRDIAVLLEEHNRNKKYIGQLEQNITELQRDVDVRTKLVNDKEVCLIEALDKCQSIEKIKQFMNERAIELETQLKPLDEEIKQKNYQIMEMAEMKHKHLRKIDDLNIEINSLKNRYKGIMIDLKSEKTKNIHSETIIKRMCTDISFLAQNVQDLAKLKKLTLEMFNKYVILVIFFKLCIFFQILLKAFFSDIRNMMKMSLMMLGKRIAEMMKLMRSKRINYNQNQNQNSNRLNKWISMKKMKLMNHLRNQS